MAKLKTKEEMKLYRKYHSPGGGNFNSVKLNTIFITCNEKGGYTKEHELMKFELAWEARKNGENFITEAQRRSTDEEAEIFKSRSKKKIVDFLNLSRAQEVEIIHRNENDKQIKFYRDTGVIPILVGHTMVCERCQGKYPKRKKKNICQICTKIIKEEKDDQEN